ncbi:hypothetical protein BO82DRAFT_367985 [Aspergillus uvarum CBS 121591]|uniref:Aminoglycoside phosphotransferase domain-containing protein n=1 Tax=Aspergillus uvarum CBS 121591 TaxID=1448315 RepID=A0A319BWL4_9EURO|nr:hypothetical protein BO82DRAFT_367985 [Aspergillus uvarum CBS 121591]PYH78086.1 hypothetical protein BO82DRAFT_367985 [Aspergillus uvarum CBS 121591]
MYDYRHIHQGKDSHTLGGITWKLSQLRFERIGSLFEEEGFFQMKECLSRGHILHERYDLETSRGPFTSETEFWDSLISAFVEHAEALPLSHHCFVAPVPSPEDYQSGMQYKGAVSLWNDFVTVGRKLDSSENRLDYSNVGNALRDILHGGQLPAIIPETFPLCHADLSVNNIYVDDDYNITRIIDWAFASSIPESMFSDLRTSFTDGFIAAMPGAVEKSLINSYRESPDRAHVAWSLSRLLSLDYIADYDLFATVWHSFQKAH